MAHVLTIDHTVLPATHTFIHTCIEGDIPAFAAQPQSLTPRWLVLISRLAQGRRLS